MSKILVCDANEQVREFLRAGVQAAGYNPVLARDDEEALSILNFTNAVGALLGAAGPPAGVVALGKKIKAEKGEQFPVMAVGGQDMNPGQIEKPDCVDVALKAPKPQALIEEVKKHFKVVVDEDLARLKDQLGREPEVEPSRKKSASDIRGVSRNVVKGVAGAAKGARVITEKAPPSARTGVGAAQRERERRAREAAGDAGTEAAAPADTGTAPPADTGGAKTIRRRPAPQPQEPAKAAEEYEFPKDGSLLEQAVGSLLYRATVDKITGKLTLLKEDVIKHSFFKSGKLVHAMSNQSADSIAGMLLEQGKITKEQLADVEVMAEKMGGAEGALMALGIIQGDQIMDLLKSSTESLMLDVFEWTAGRFKFEEGEKPPKGAAPMPHDVVSMVKNGVERWDGDRIKLYLGERLEQRATKNHTAMESVEKLGLKPNEFRLTRLVNGMSTGSEILAEWTGGDPDKQTRGLQLLLLLFWTAMIDLPEPRKTYKAPPPPKPEVKAIEMKKSATELEAKIEGLQGKTYFEVLGVDRGADLQTCKKAYLKLARTYHPDTLPGDASDELRKAQDLLFGIYSEANDTLSDEAKRTEYIADLDAQDSLGDTTVDKVLEAEVIFQQGEVQLKKKDYAGAVESFETAVEYNSEEAEHYVMLGWAKYLNSGAKDFKTGKALIKKGLKMRTDIDVGWLYLGHIEKAHGDIEKAEKFYLKSLQINPNNGEAASEARLIQKRKGGKGLFKK